jgi:hypothetical protein
MDVITRWLGMSEQIGGWISAALLVVNGLLAAVAWLAASAAGAVGLVMAGAVLGLLMISAIV